MGILVHDHVVFFVSDQWGQSVAERNAKGQLPSVRSHSDAIGGDLEPEQFRKLFIGGLTSSTTDETLKDFYSQWGQLLDCIVMRDPTTKRSRGFGFVTFTKQSEVNAAMANRPHVIDGKTVDPKRAVPRELSQRSEANISSKRLYVSGVREDHTEQMFSDYFSNYGNVIKCDIIADKSTGKRRGFAFVTFDDYDSVDRCVLMKSHTINNARCDVKKALSKEEMARVRHFCYYFKHLTHNSRSENEWTVECGRENLGWGGDMVNGVDQEVVEVATEGNHGDQVDQEARVVMAVVKAEDNGAFLVDLVLRTTVVAVMVEDMAAVMAVVMVALLTLVEEEAVGEEATATDGALKELVRLSLLRLAF
ncbi:unnamed protein product [Toxocara canis]|uniref:Heterogeneous nuclear ribonucleoprotein A1 n=1 Tax=Toxocara canis TaxID=6265 RepID=A0A183UCX3_TOXCA|nr:unnamed protein product [Toxocara canis]